MNLTPEQKLEALKLRYVDHVELLRFMTTLDFQVMGGYFALQLAVVAWFSEHPLSGLLARAGLVIIDLLLAIVVVALLRNNLKRRREVTATLKNINSALGFNEPGVYAEHAINAATKFRPWAPWYMSAVAITFLVIALLTLSGY